MKTIIKLDGFETLNAINSGTLEALTQVCIKENRSRTITPEVTIDEPKKEEEPAEEPKKDKEAPAEEPDAMTFKTFQARISKVNRAGHIGEVKEMVKARGGAKLSDIKPEDYEAFLAEAEALI